MWVGILIGGLVVLILVSLSGLGIAFGLLSKKVAKINDAEIAYKKQLDLSRDTKSYLNK